MNYSRYIICLLFFILYCCGLSEAGNETVSSLISGNQIVNNAFVSVQDNNYPNVELSGASKVSLATSSVIFSVDNASNLYFNASSTVKLGLVLTSYDKNGIAQTLPGIVELELGYSPTGSYKDKSVYVVFGSHKISATIQYIKNAANVVIPNTSIPQNLKLEVEQSSERYYAFNTSIPPTMGTVALLVPSNELDIHWNIQQGAEEYELEWTYVNDYSYSGGTLAPTDVFCNFKDNSTRVRLSDIHYPISLVYDQGYIVYRVRGIGHPFTDLNKELFGEWSAVESGPVSSYAATDYYTILPTDRHEKSKNWQYSASYAEEGKKKEVVSYFDGSLRNRQSVTKLNTSNKIIVGETIYDYQGRGAVQVLPTPTLESAIKFYPDFNKSVALGLPAYSRKDFDEDTPNSTCVVPPLGMSTTVGSSNYYSAANPDKTGVQAYVPDAKLFPFSQVEFTPDNTGRIRRQSGVGADHQLGSDHETKYFYGQPEQAQLDRLFGSEVGDYQHYKKNMVKDANGQVSVSYLDQQGRVIATSLAGNSPPNLNALTGGNPPTVLTVNYLKANDPLIPNSNIIQGNALIFSKELLVDASGSYDFYYDLEAPRFQEACLPSPICYDCIYDLEISVTDDCGTPMFTSIKEQVGVMDTVCSGANITFNLGGPAPAHITVTLPEGSYSVNKKLTISERAIDYYTTNFVKNNTCIKPYQTFLDSAMARIDTTACEISCEQCASSLGLPGDHNDITKINDPNYNYMTQEAYDKAIKDCKAPCEYANLCESQYQTLLSDVSPAGQYAKYAIDENGNDISSDVLSLFNINNRLPDRYDGITCPVPAFTSFWRNPKRTIQGTPQSYYYEEDGSISRIPVTLQSDGSYYPLPYIPSVCYPNDPVKTDPIDNSKYIYPQDLKNTIDFIHEFGNHPDWAKSLVEYHPEYAYYKWCIENSNPAFSQGAVPLNSSTYYTSDGFDDLLRSKNTFNDAVAAGLLNGTSPTDLLILDPYFKSGSESWQGGSQGGIMSALLNTYNDPNLSLKAVCGKAVLCGTVYYGTPTNCDFGTGTLAEQNQQWVLYRDIYLSEKQKLQQKAADISATFLANRYNGCIGIGAGSYNPWGAGPFSWSNPIEPCGATTWYLYKDKTKRFQNGNGTTMGVDLSGSPQAALNTLVNNIEYNAYLETGQCPLASDLGFLLDNLAQQHQLVSSGFNLVSNAAFTKKLYDAIKAPDNPSILPFINYYWVSSVTSGTLNVQFKNLSTGLFDDCTLSLTLPGTYVWEDVIRFSSIQYTNGSAPYNFTITAFIDNDLTDAIPAEQVTLSGSTFIPLNGCSFPDNCGPSTIALRLQNLFNGLKSQSELLTSNVDLAVSPYATLYADQIPLPTGVTFTTIEWDWSNPTSLGTINYTLSDLSTSSCGFSFNFVNLGSGYIISDIEYFSHITPDATDPTHYFNVDAWVVDHFEPMRVYNAEGCFNFKTCAPPPNLQPTGSGCGKNGDFIAGLNAIVSQNRLFTDFPLTGFPAFEALYDDVIPGGYLSWIFAGCWQGCPGVNNITKTYTAFVGNPFMQPCSITMQFTNTNNTHTYSDITGFAGLEVPASGNGSTFTMIALFSDGSSQLLNCSLECLVLTVCEHPETPIPCTKTTKVANLMEMNFDSFSSSSPGFSGDRTHDEACTFDIAKYYVVNDATTDCVHQDYTAAGRDHTNPGTGKFLLFNFVFSGPTVLWEKNISGIQPNTNYIFSYWIQRCNARFGYPWEWSIDWTPGSLQMEIDGTVSNTLVPQTQDVWEQVTKTWNSGNNTSGTVSLKIISALQMGVLGIDDINFEQVSIVPCILTQADPSILPILPYVNPCVQNLKDIATANALASYNFYIETVKADFRQSYLSLCKNPFENLKMVYTDREHHITLYYYDQAGNLIRTVPPEGVALVTASADLNQILQDRVDKTHTFFTKHTLITKYEYNSLNQLLRQATPDNDLMNKWELNGLGTLPVGSNIYGMAFSNGNSGFVVGDNGTGIGVIYITADGGNSWSPVSSLGIDNLQDIQMVGAIGYAIAQPGYLVKTIDDGLNWTIIPTSTQQLNDLHFFDDQNGIVIGKNGTILQTFNGGGTWTVPFVTGGVSADLNDIQFLKPPSTTGYIVGNAGTVLTSTNNGGSWIPIPGSPLSTSINLNAVDFSNDPIGFVVGENSNTHKGVVLKYSMINPIPITFGWTSQLITTNAAVFTALNMNATSGKGYVGGSNGAMYKTTNYSSTWTQQIIPGFTADITEMHFPDNSGNPDIGYATTANGKVLKLAPIPNTWDIYSPPVSAALNGLYFSDINTGYVVGDGGVILKYDAINGIWTSLTNVNFAMLNDACFAAGSSSVGYAVGKTGTIIKTTNGGNSWSTVSNANTSDLNAVYFTDANSGTTVGNAGLITEITGGGAALAPQIVGTTNLNDITYTPSGKGIIVGNGRVILVKNGIWGTTAITGSGTEDLYAVSFVATTGYACGSNGAIYKTIDDGANWTSLNTGVTALLREIYFKDLLIGYAMGDNGTIIKTIDGGINWIIETGIAGDFQSSHFSDDGHALLAGTGATNLSTLFDGSNDHSSRFWYDRLGRLVVSQNGKQFNKTPKAYSYTKYDALGRITEVGETAIFANITTIANIHGVIGNDAAFTVWLAGGAHTEVTSTLYDVAVSPSIAGFTQENLRKRVSSVTYEDVDDNNPLTFQNATDYSYDIHGNVKTLLQDNPSLAAVTPSQQYKKIDYIYDLVSGKVNQVSYQNGEPDAFYHKYEYDADNRITNVISSKDGVIWDKDANYFYYQHGPLARTELGDQKVQAMDYAFTIQGWLKGVNSETLLPVRDIGKDGEENINNLNRNFARDAFGYSLNYFANDYMTIETIPTIDNFMAAKTGSDLMASRNDLFNGNIGSVVTTINNLSGVALPNAMAYKYDQLNRISEGKGFSNIDAVNNTWQSGSTYNGRYYNNYSFDANGNILTALVKNDAGTIIDDQTYHYQTVNGKRVNNKLYAISDNAATTAGFDLPSTQAAFNNTLATINTANNYGYGERGEMKFDKQDDILDIKRRADENITEIVRTTGTGKTNLKFSYDAFGKRVAKHKSTNAGVWFESEYYIRDATGNIMSTYKYTIDALTEIASFKQTERHIYGSSLLGIDKTTTELIGAAPSSTNFSRVLGHKQYSLQNHLQNDLVVVSDRKIPNDITSDGLIDFYTADILLARDYGVYGEYLTNRVFNPNDYPNSFNGKRDDEELFGWQNYGYRNYLKGRRGFDRVDDLASKYPELSPYQFASNSPIAGIDQDGEEFRNFMAALKFLYMGGIDALSIAKIKDGYGRVQTQVYTLKTMGDAQGFTKLKETFLNSPQKYTNNPRATYMPIQKAKKNTLSKDDEIAIQLKGSMAADALMPIFVRVIDVQSDDPNSFSMTFATLEGHADAGTITFSGVLKKDGTIEVKISNITRGNLELGFFAPGTARDIQISQWESVVKNISKALGEDKTKEMTKQITEYFSDPSKEDSKGEKCPDIPQNGSTEKIK